MKTYILIADDEPNQLELMAFNLESAGFSIIRAQNGKEVIELVEDNNPDLIILDWMMPKMSGIDVCRALRSKAETKLLPIIILSARSEEGEERTVDVHMSRLRKALKLNSSEGQNVIRTVRDGGYGLFKENKH